MSCGLKRSLIAFAVFCLIFSVMLTLPGSAEESGVAAIGTIPTMTMIPLEPLLIVDIPDANLKAALHAACDKPLDEPLRRIDLAGLSGNLSVSNRDIADLEGIQFCINLTTLNASRNPLNDLPDLSRMENLEYLYLTECAFTHIPEVISQLPNLQDLSLNSNQIVAIDGVSGSMQLSYLHLAENMITELPEVLELPQLEMLNLTYNQLTSLSVGLMSCTNLQTLFLGYNQLAELPANIGSLPALHMLVIHENRVRSLPASLGSSTLEYLYAGQNLITSLPATLTGSAHLSGLDLRLNRLTGVPEGLADMDLEMLDLEFNYIDVSDGSPNRSVLESVVSHDKRFLRQLTPIQNLRTESTPGSIQISWDLSPDTETTVYYTRVKNYIVYLNQSGGLVMLATLGKAANSFADTGLASDTERRYTVAVVYEVVAPMVSATSRHYTSLTTRTAAPTPTPVETETPTETQDPPAEITDRSAETSASSAPETAGTQAGTDPETPDEENPEDTQSRIPIWLVIILALVAGAGITATAILLGFRRKANKP